MTDTQWPRYVVFTQARPDKPHLYAGSVHAPDAEIALLNARDVFSRRPECVDMWVVPANAIFSRTSEQIASGSEDTADEVTRGGSSEPYCVFLKLDHRSLHSYAGRVTASSPAAALVSARELFTEKDALVWWLFPERLVTRSRPEDIDQMYLMAETARFYRDQGQYHTVATLRQIKAEREGKKLDGG